MKETNHRPRRGFLDFLKTHITDLGIFALLAILTLIFFWKIALTNRILVGLDVFTYFYPYRAYAAEALRGGRIPLWNPYLFMGVPFLANSQVGLFYPLNLLLLWLSPPRWLSYSIVLHVFLAAIFTYIFAHHTIKLPRRAALLSAIIFAFSGFISAQVEHINQLQAAVWLPLMLVLFSRVYPHPRPLREAYPKGYSLSGRGENTPSPLWGEGWGEGVLLLPLIIAIQLFAGHTQAVYINLAALALYALIRPHKGGGTASFSPIASFVRVLIRPFAHLLICIFAAFLLAAIQLLPTMELARLSLRGGGLDYYQATSFSLKPSVLLVSLLPAFGDTPFTEYVAYVGFGALFLAALAVWTYISTRKFREWFSDAHFIFAVALAFTGLFLAFGRYNPVYYLCYKIIPGFSLFRVPARWLYLYTFGTAILAGYGAAHIAKSTNQQKRKLANRQIGKLIIIGLTAIFILLLLWRYPPSTATLIKWAILATTSLLITYHISRFTSHVSRFTFYILLFFIPIELFIASRGLAYNHPTAPEAYFNHRNAISFLLADAQLDPTIPTPRFLSMSDIEYDPGDMRDFQRIFADQLPEREIYDYIVAAKQKEILAPNLPLRFHIPAVDGYDGGVLPLKNYNKIQQLFLPPDKVSPDGRLREQLRRVPPARLLSLLNVKHIITDKVFDVWIDGFFYDLQYEVILDADNPTIATALPDFQTNALGIVSFLEDARDFPDDEPVAEITITDEAGEMHHYYLHAGVHTAEGEYNLAPAAHAAARVARTWRDNPDGNLYIAVFNLVAPTRPRSLTIRYLPNSGALHMRGVSLLERVSATSQALTLSSTGHFRLMHSGDVKVYENLDNLPRAFLVHRARVMDDDAAIAYMQSADFTPDREVILAPESQTSEVLKASEVSFANFAQVITYEPERIEIETQTAQSAYLVLTDSYYPGWRAFVDGAETPIHRADVLFRAVEVPAGVRRVEFVYRPRSFRIGAIVSIITLGAIIIGLIWRWMN